MLLNRSVAAHRCAGTVPGLRDIAKADNDLNLLHKNLPQGSIN